MTLHPETALRPGTAATSPNSRYRLFYQTDGNLVLYGPDGPLWDSETDGRGAGACIMQADGNLVLYGPNDEYVWDTETDNNPGSRLPGHCWLAWPSRRHRESVVHVVAFEGIEWSARIAFRDLLREDPAARAEYFEAKIQLPDGSYERVSVQGESYEDAREVLNDKILEGHKLLAIRTDR